MYILLAIIAAVAIGAVIQVTVAGSEKRGLLVSGAVAAAVAAVIYTVFTWIGVGEASVWTWLASIGGAALVSFIATVALTRTRVAHDAAEDARLSIG